jgi:ATP-dependent RNA helicase SUPV3L1/SUV3
LDDAFALNPMGDVLWRGEVAGYLTGADPFKPQVRLAGELGPRPARDRAARRLEAFVAAQASQRLAPLKRLMDAVASGTLKGLARGLAYRLIEGGGWIARQAVEGDLLHLSRTERRALKTLGVRFGQFTLSIVLTEAGAALARAFAARAVPDSPQALGLRGKVRIGRLAVTGVAGGSTLSDAARADLGWSGAQARDILRALGYAPWRNAETQAVVWRRRRPATARLQDPIGGGVSPFAALAALRQTPAAPPQRPRRRAARGPRHVRH